MNEWVSISVTVPADAEEAVEFALNTLGALGTQVYIPREISGRGVTVVGYFDESPGEVPLEDEIAYAFAVHDVAAGTAFSTNIGRIEEQDWLAEWKKHWQPTTLGRFVIAPPWAQLEANDKIVIRIEPNMAFGTGTHETTQLCLRAIDESFSDGMSFLDVGTGTGILAIAAAKQSPTSRIMACDVDEESVKIARENADGNGVGGIIEFFDGTIDETTSTFDLVCANLTLDVIKPLLALFFAKADRQLLLSGILVEQEGDIARELSKFEMSDLEFSYAGEWLSALITK